MSNKSNDYIFCSLNTVYSCTVIFARSNNSFLLQLPGVDPNDPSVKDLLASMQNQSEVSLSTMEKHVWLQAFLQYLAYYNLGQLSTLPSFN